MTALITGGGGGIGSAIAARLARDGLAVAVADIDVDAAAAHAERIGAGAGAARAYRLDVSDAAAVARVVAQVADELGPVDVLVNNAGYADQTAFLDLEPAQWQAEFGVIVDGAINCTRAVLTGMRERRRGAIVNVGSVNGLAFYSHPTYSAAKAAVFSLTQSLAALFGGDGVRINAVAPGTIRTPIWEAALAQDPEILGALVPYIPLARIGTAEHVADAVAFLASDAAAHITGVVLPVDGGLTSGILPMAHRISGTR